MSDNDTSRQDSTLGRRIGVLAFGDNADEIELYALDAARKFFGADIALEIARDYEVHDVRPASALAADASGKGWYARVTVCERAGA